MVVIASIKLMELSHPTLTARAKIDLWRHISQDMGAWRPSTPQKRLALVNRTAETPPQPPQLPAPTASRHNPYQPVRYERMMPYVAEPASVYR